MHRTIASLALATSLFAAPALAQTEGRVVVPPPPPVSSPVTPIATAPTGRPGTVITPTAETDSEIRQRDELARIDAAARGGLIDARERAHLERALTRLQAYQERAYADGVLSLREQSRLARYHARIDRAITRAIAR